MLQQSPNLVMLHAVILPKHYRIYVIVLFIPYLYCLMEKPDSRYVIWLLAGETGTQVVPWLS